MVPRSPPSGALSAHFKRRYGAGPLHLLVHLLGFAIATFALIQLLGEKRWVNFLAWFAGAALLHDLVLLPLYTLLDGAGRGFSRRLHAHLPGGPADAAPGRPGHVPIVNHVRAPALVSGLLALIYFPLILGPSDPQYLSATGHHPAGYLRNWLLISLALFLGSAVLYTARVLVARRLRGGSTPA